MGWIHFIAKRLHRPQMLPPSFRAMRRVTLLGIVIAVATLVVSLSIARGFESAYKRALLDFNAHIVLLRSGNGGDDKDLFVHLQGMQAGTNERERIVGMTPFLYREGLAIAHGGMRGVVIKGVDAVTLRSVNRMKVDLKRPNSSLEAELNDVSVMPSIIVGKALAKNLLLSENEEVLTLMIPDLQQGKKPAHRYVRLRVAGIFESGMYDYDSQFILMSLAEVRKLFSLPPHEITGIELALHDPERAPKVIGAIEEWLPPTYEAASWADLNHDLFSAIQLEKRVFTIIMGMLVIVAAFNITSVLVLLILFRRPQVSVLSVLGASRREIMRLLTISGFEIGGVGVFLGMVVGVLVSLLLSAYPLIELDPEIYFLDRLPLDISPLLCGIIATFCLATCFGISRVVSQRLAKAPLGEGLKQSY